MTKALHSFAPITPADQARMLLGDTDGWPLAPVIHWLTTEGCRTNDAKVLLDGLAEAMLEAGAPVWRLRLAFWTIHPLLAAVAHQWIRGEGVTRYEVGHGIFDSPDFIGSPAEELRDTRKPVRYRMDDSFDPAAHHEVLGRVKEMGGTDYYALPMVSFNGQIDSLFLATDDPGGFSDGDIAKFDALGRYLLPVIESISQHRLSVVLLDTYVGERTGRRVLEGKIKRGDGETIEAALWFSDLRDFTHLTETQSSPALLDLLNTYFEFVYNAVHLYGGEVLRFIGDAMLVVFPIEDGRSREQACADALAAAEDAFSSLAALNHLRKRHDQPEIRFGVGLHVGRVIYGNVGAPNRLDFTVMGPAVNRTARLEGLTKQTGTSLLLSERFAGLVDREVTNLGAFTVKGIEEPISAFSLD